MPTILKFPNIRHGQDEKDTAHNLNVGYAVLSATPARVMLNLDHPFVATAPRLPGVGREIRRSTFRFNSRGCGRN